MHTPFEIIRNKQRSRKSKINQSQSPPIFTFSLENSRKFSPCLDDRSQEKRRNGRIKSQSLKKKRKVMKSQQQQNYQIKVKNTLKKLSLFKLSHKKHHQKFEQMPAYSLNNKNSCKKLVIEGSPCSKDLIKLNKNKLQYMISKIKNNNSNSECPENIVIPQVIISKCQLEKPQIQKINKSHHHNLHQNYFVSTARSREETQSKSKQYLNKSSFCQNRKQSQTKLQFDPKQYLICSQIKNKEKYETNLEFVLNNKNIVDYIKQSKKKKPTLYEKQKFKETDFKNQINFQIKSQRKAMCKTCKTQHIKRNQITSKSQRKKLISNIPGVVFNGVNFDNLKGWQNPTQTIDDIFIAPSYLY